MGFLLTLNIYAMRTLLLIFSFCFIVSCNNDDDNTTEPVNTTIYDTWSLVKFEAGLGPTLLYEDEILWTITTDNTIHVTVEDGTDIWGSLPLNETGTYPYEIAGVSITFDNVGYIYEMSGNELTITDAFGQALDGRKLTFTRWQQVEN